MRAALLTGVLAVAFAASALAKGETKKITIAGDKLASPIVITDPAVLGRFNVWTGPGTGGTVHGVEWKATEGFVVGSSTPVDPAPERLARYVVTFLVDRQDRDGHDMAYVIFYEYDAKADRGFVYFPGRNDPQGKTNVFLIMRDLEGRWYPASRAWQDVVTPLIK